MRPGFAFDDHGVKLVLFWCIISLLPAASTSAVDIDRTVVCCNGGTPRVRSDRPDPGLTFQPINSTGSCILYRLYPGNADSSGLGSKDQLREFVLECNCSPDSVHFGDRCELRNEPLLDSAWPTDSDFVAANTAALSSSENGSFKVFLFIAIIPLSFALLAVLGAFVCRMCFCDCFAIHDSCKKCWSKDPYNLESSTDLAEEALMDRYRAAYRFDTSSSVLAHRSEERRAENATSANQEAMIADPPPPFDSIDPIAACYHGAGLGDVGVEPLDAVITVQPKSETLAIVHRKYSPPPPYTATEERTLSNADAATQTQDILPV